MPDDTLLRSLDETRLLECLSAFKKGDFSARLPLDWTGVAGKIADNLNDILQVCEQFGIILRNGARTVGKEGKFDQRIILANGMNGWSDWAGSVNQLIEDLLRPTIEMARVIGAVAKGDLSEQMTLEFDGRPLEGQFLNSAKTINTMVDQLNAFAGEVMRVAREVGTSGTLGGQARVKGMGGAWKWSESLEVIHP